MPKKNEGQKPDEGKGNKRKPNPKSNRGGKRKGAGRPKGTGKWGEPTKAVRVPESKADQIMLYDERLCTKIPDDFIPPKIDRRRRRMRIPKPPKSTRMFGCPVSDDSMSPKIKSNEIALVYPQFTPENGDVVVVYYDGLLYMRTYRRSRGKITLTPENPQFETISVDDMLEFEIYGVVKDSISENV